MNYKILLLPIFFIMSYIGAVSQSKIAAEVLLALTKIETPSSVILFEYDPYGRVASETKEVFENGYLSYKFEYEYDESGNMVSLKKYTKEFDVWNFMYYEENEYNNANQMVTNKAYEDYGAGFRFVKQLFYTYQDTFLETLLEQLISSSGQSFNNIRQDFFYNKQYQLLQVKKNDWIGNSWMHTETFDFEYDAFGNVLYYTSEILIGEEFVKNWRYVFTYNDAQELVERALYRGFYEWNKIPEEKYLYHFETAEENQAILFPNIYQFDLLDFNWFHTGKKLILDEYWVSDCGGNIHFIESANYTYTPFSIGVGVENYEKEDIWVYPNPTTGELRMENGELRITNVEIFDVYGRKQQSNPELNSGVNLKSEIVINISNLNSGIYFVKITTEQGEVVKKVVKQ